MLFFGFWLLLFEILKQTILIYDQGNFEYDWQHLPLQPCSAVMYTIILAGFLSTSKKAEKDFIKNVDKEIEVKILI